MRASSQTGALVMSTYVLTGNPGAWNVATHQPSGTRVTWSTVVVKEAPGRLMNVPDGIPIQTPWSSPPR